MKKVLALSIMAFMALTSCAQEIPQNMVPSVVLNAFQQKFTKVSDVEWERKGDLFEVEFEMSFNDHKALIDSTGKVVRHKEEITKSALPAAVKKTLDTDFIAYKVDDIDKIIEAGKTYFKIEVENATEEKDIYLGEDGKLLNPAPALK